MGHTKRQPEAKNASKSQKSIYDTILNNEPFVIKRHVRIACCDCDLVHDFIFKILEDATIQIKVVRNNHATSALRRHSKTQHSKSSKSTKT